MAACLAVAIITFGVEMHNDESPQTLFAPASLTVFAVQGVILLVISAAMFLLKLALSKMFGVSDISRPKPLA